MRVLCLDAGSASLKYALYDQNAHGGKALTTGEFPSKGQSVSLLEDVWSKLESEGYGSPDAVGHRVVFGNTERALPARVDDDLLARLDALRARDPLHLVPELEIVRAARTRFPRAVHVLCFDTAFFSDLPALARCLPLPRDLPSYLQRCGFHGLSYEWAVKSLKLSGRAVVAHLGSGASLCAVVDGAPLETTFGFGVLGGLMMETRLGDLDPSVLLELMREGYSVERLSRLLYEESGLKGVSGLSGDMRELLSAEASDVNAARAVALFLHQLRKHLGAMIAVLGGLETLVFTGGIGEHAPSIRERACAPFGYLGLRLDAAANERGAAVISESGSAVCVRVIAANENAMIAQHVWNFIETAA